MTSTTEYYYYWRISSTQSTSYTWYITGTYNDSGSNGTLYNAPSSTNRNIALCTISSNITYTYTGILPYYYINIFYKSRNISYKYFNPLTIYRSVSNYGWG